MVLGIELWLFFYQMTPVFISVNKNCTERGNKMESTSDPLNKGYFSQIQTLFSNWGQNISEKASDLGSRIADVFSSAMEKLKTALNTAADKMSTTASRAYQTLEDMYIALFYRSRRNPIEKINIDVFTIQDTQNRITTETDNVPVHNAPPLSSQHTGSNHSINHTNNTSNNEMINPSDSETPENPTEQSDSWKQDAVTLCKIAGTVCTLATLMLSTMVWLTSGDGIEQDLTI